MDPDLQLPFTHGERRLALAELLRFAENPSWQPHLKAAAISFFAGLPEGMSDEEIQHVFGHENVRICLRTYQLSDYRRGRSYPPATQFLKSPRARLLTAGSRNWLQLFALSAPMAYEVTAVTPGKSCRVRSLLDRQELLVLERTASRELQPGAALLTRVMSDGQGGLCFEGILPVLGTPRSLQRRVVDLWRELGLQEMDHATQMAFGKGLSPLVMGYWAELVLRKVRNGPRRSRRSGARSPRGPGSPR